MTYHSLITEDIGTTVCCFLRKSAFCRFFVGHNGISCSSIKIKSKSNPYPNSNSLTFVVVGVNMHSSSSYLFISIATTILLQRNSLDVNVFLILFLHHLGHDHSQDTVFKLGRNTLFIDLDTLLELDFPLEGANLSFIQS